MAKGSADRNAKLSALNSKTLAKARGSVHPNAVLSFRPERRVKIPDINTADAYGRLTDSSSYSEYTWEFLRRNRFYQAMIDKGPSFDIEIWGYRHSPDVPFGFGLIEPKSYWETLSEAGLISYSRGRIAVLDRARLEQRIGHPALATKQRGATYSPALV